MKFYYLYFIVSLTGSSANAGQFKIINGFQTHIVKFPFLVGLMFEDEQLCGASIISNTVVLTAAHCVARFVGFEDAFAVFAGSNHNNGKHGHKYGVDEIIYHKKYNMREYINDIAILKINGTFEFNEIVQPVPLASEGSVVVTGMLCEIVGWGQTETETLSTKLNSAEIPVFEYGECRRRFENLMIYLNENVFCAGIDGERHDTCQGDSGGPIIYEGIQIGIVSFGHDCGSDWYPGVYTDIRKFNQWIRNAIDDLG